MWLNETAQNDTHIMTLNLTTICIMTCSLMNPSRMTHSIMMLKFVKFKLTTLYNHTQITTISIMTFKITKLLIVSFSIITFEITKLI